MPNKIKDLTLALTKERIEEDLLKIEGKNVETKNKKWKLGEHENGVLNSDLENHLCSSTQSRNRKVNQSEVETKSDEFEVERIMKSKKDKNGNWMLLIRWANHPPSEDSWIPASNLLDPIYTYDFDDSLFQEDN